MVVLDKLVYLQLHKTACSHIARLLVGCLQGKQEGKHNRLSEIPPDKYILGSIRNPWDWYVSLWAFGANGKGMIRERLLRPASTLKTYLYAIKKEIKERKSFPRHALLSWYSVLRQDVRIWKHAYADPESPEAFRLWLHQLLNVENRYLLGERYGESPISRFGGLLSYRYAWFYWRDIQMLYQSRHLRSMEDLIRLDAQENILHGIVRMESLEEDLLYALHQAGYGENHPGISCIRQMITEKTNASRHRPPAYYYDEASFDLVRERERLIIEKYNYTGPSEGST